MLRKPALKRQADPEEHLGSAQKLGRKPVKDCPEFRANVRWRDKPGETGTPISRETGYELRGQARVGYCVS